MTEIIVSVTLNGDIDLEKIAKAIRKEIECAIVKAEITEPERLKVGDYVKTITSSKHGHISKEETVKIEHLNFPTDSGHSVAVRHVRGGGDGLFKPTDLIKATDEEVADAKRKQAENVEAEKWAKIGRKPNQLKVGDIVLRSPGYYDVVANPFGNLRLETGEELITPVEARFDK